MQNHGYLEMISPLWPQNRPSCQEVSPKILHKLQGNPFLDVMIVPCLKANIETPLASINPLVIQTHLNLSQIMKGLVQKTGFFVPLPRRDVNQTLRVHSVLENPNIGPTDPLNCFRLQDKLLKTPFQKSIIYPSIGSGGSPYISGSEQVIAKRGHTKDPFYQRRFLQPPVSCTNFFTLKGT